MKLFTSTIALLLSVTVLQAQTNKSLKSSSLPNRFGSIEKINGVNENWLSDVENRIRESEYYFSNDAGSDMFTVANKAQHISFAISPTEFTTFPMKYAKKRLGNSDWNQSLIFSEIKKGETHLYANKKFTYSNKGSDLIFSYSGFDIEYKNTEEGLRQNFIVKNKPAGSNDLELVLKIQGELSPSLEKNDLQFSDKNGAVRLFYKDLKVWDADHHIINASMELRDKNTLAIVVKDQSAKYPLTIDPINKTPEWTTSADGILPALIGQAAVDAAYGFTVAGLGDVNGDGFDDVAVGAPTLVDIISGTGALADVGAVFVYFGGISGLSTSPTAVLHPTTPVAGALFGYSIAGGDINADGKSDIIIGAPMDVVTLSIGGGSTVSGTVGKVYAYNGVTVSTGVNPLLTLSLSGNGILENGVNLSVNALFGFSVAVTQDLNIDGRKDIIVGAPTYAGIKNGLLGNSLLDVQSGGAFVFLSNGNNPHTLVKLNPFKTNLLGLGLLSENIDGLRFGYSVDGLGDYNGDGKPDVVASAPAGVDLSSLSALLNGKLLQGSATIYYGTGAGVNANSGAILTATSGGLLSNLAGSLSNVANLFGVSVRGVKNAGGIRNGNVLVGAPLGGVLTNVLGLNLKAGTVSVFKKKSLSPSGYVVPDQVLNSPRNSNTILGLIQANLLFGYSIDNTLDLNCDGIGDIIVGEPASSGLQLVNANLTGGAAYVYLGKSDGTYVLDPSWSLTATEDAFLGINASSLIGYSVAGAGHVRGIGFENRILVGSPARTLDFGSGLLNLGATLGTLFSLTSGDNGVGKAFLFNSQLCASGGPLPITLIKLNGTYADGISHLSWSTAQETNSKYFEIEHSSDGIVFNDMNRINAAGNSNVKIDYEFEDNAVNPGSNYYRLKMTDADGQITYSNIIILNVNLKDIFITSVYPTPFTDKININISADNAVTGSAKLFDVTGREIVSKDLLIHKGLNTINLGDIGRLSKGSYIIKVQAGNTFLSKKLIK